MIVSRLYNRYKGRTIYIVGTGPTLRVFPKMFLQNEITIGLNRAWESMEHRLTYNLTIHPELIPRDFWQKKQTWITKRKDWLTNTNRNLANRIFFIKNNHNPHDYSYLKSNTGHIYIGRGIHTGALSLAAKMGATNAVLVGCDFGQVGKDHHATAQTTQFYGLGEQVIYNEYYLNCVELRKKLKEAFGMEILTLSAILGYRPEKDYDKLCEEQGLDALSNVDEVTKVKRKHIDFIE